MLQGFCQRIGIPSDRNSGKTRPSLQFVANIEVCCCASALNSCAEAQQRTLITN